MTEGGVAAAKQIWGKEMSYNNFLDTHSAFELVKEFKEPAAVIIKHNNPCGVATGATLVEAYKKAKATDPVSPSAGSPLSIARSMPRPLKKLPPLSWR